MRAAKILFSMLMFFVMGLFFYAGRAEAVLTKQLSYQGRLNDASGQPVPNGTYSVTFSIYNVSTGGTALYSETQNVAVNNGGFSTYIGSVTPLALPFTEDYFLGITVGADPEMTPRLKLAIVGTSVFALDAGNAANLGGQPAGNYALSSNVVTQIVAGSNVTISPANGTGAVTINAAGGGGGTPLTPAASVTSVGASNIVGTSPNYAREDHVHSIPANFITDPMISNTAGIATSKLSGTVTAIPGNGLGALATLNTVGSPQIVDGSIGLVDIGSNGCASGQIMKYNGSAWACDVDLTGGGGGVLFNPTSTQTILAGNATTTPLLLKGAATPSVPIFEVDDNGGQLKLGVMPDGHVFIPATNILHVLSVNNDSPTGPMGNMVVDVMNSTANSKLSVTNSDATFTASLDVEGRVFAGLPTTTSGMVSALQAGSTGNAGYFENNNVSNTNAAVSVVTGGSPGVVSTVNSGAGNAIIGNTAGTATAASFNITNAGNTATLIYGNHAGGGALLELQKGGVDKFVVDNNGNITIGGVTDPNAVKINPATTQTVLAGAANITPLVVKSAASPTANIFDVQDNTGASMMKVLPAGNVMIGSSPSSAHGLNIGVNSGSLIIYGNQQGAGNLMALAQGGINKFLVSNTGMVATASIDSTSILDGSIADADISGTAAIALSKIANSSTLVVNNPAASQMIVAGNATTVPLALKAAATPSVPVFDIQDSTATSLVKVDSAGSLLVGNPSTIARVSAYETGTLNSAGYFELNNASNGSAALYGLATSGPGIAVVGTSTGTGKAGMFQIANVGNASTVILGTTTGTGNLLQLQASATDKFVVLNTGDAGTVGKFGIGTLSPVANLDFGTAANPVIKTTAVSANIALDANDAAASTVSVVNSGAGLASLIVEGDVTIGNGISPATPVNINTTNSAGNTTVFLNNPGAGLANLKVEGAFFVGTDKAVVSPSATLQKVQSGKTCESAPTDGFINITFPTAFTAAPNAIAMLDANATATTTQFPYINIPGTDLTATSVKFTLKGNDAAYVDCVQWFAIGN